MKIVLLFFLGFTIFFSNASENKNGSQLTKEEMLCTKTWKTYEKFSEANNQRKSYYKRGGSSNTIDLDSDSIKFTLDNTGTYFYLNNKHPLTWNFTNLEKTQFKMIIDFGDEGISHINLDTFSLSENIIKYSRKQITTNLTFYEAGILVPNN